jgi:small GTP-binding protein
MSGSVAHKVTMLGDSAVGKTNIIIQLSESSFNPDLFPTVGAASITRRIQTGNGEIALQIWDTARQEQFRSVVPIYVRGAIAVVLVCAMCVMELETVLSLFQMVADELVAPKTFERANEPATCRRQFACHVSQPFLLI